MQTAQLSLGASVAEVQKWVYGSFLEHMGRAVYGGVFDEGSPLSSASGLREDVISLVKELKVTIVRYPGGNFVSGYRWEDGVGNERVPRKDDAWNSTESNRFGTDEFMAWCNEVGCEPMMAVNLGTRGVDEAVALLEYCNGDAEKSKYAAMRKQNGHAEPYGVKLWCLGNEMDGPWQIGHKDATSYGKLARACALAMKQQDPTIKVVACGSSTHSMSTFGVWEKEVLEECYDVVDAISLHGYWGKFTGDSVSFLESSKDLESAIVSVARVIESVRKEKQSSHRVLISVDEWNVNYHDRMKSAPLASWASWYQSSATFEEFYFKFRDSLSEMRKDLRGMEAPPLLEDTYTLEDALVVGTLLCALVKHADVVSSACLAQLVNVIAPIRVEKEKAWKQTIFYPFQDMATFGLGVSMETSFDDPLLDGVVVRDSSGTLVLFVVNKHLDEPVTLTIPGVVLRHRLLVGELLSTCVVPREEPVLDASVLLPAHSWNTIVFRQ